MKKAKIYLRTGIGFLLLFLVVVYKLTGIQTRHISSNMQYSYHTASRRLENDIKRAADNLFTNEWDLSDLMFAINHSIYGVSQEWLYMNMHSSILLLENNKEVISRSGNFLQCMPLMIPLDQYCSEEQIDRIYKEYYDLRNGSAVFVKSSFTGYSSKWGFVPQIISLSNQEEPTKNNLTLELNNFLHDSVQIESLEEENAILWVQGFGSQNRMLTEKDRKIIKECEDMAFRELEQHSNDSNGYGTGLTRYPAYFDYSSVSSFIINGETCYLIMGVKGFPQRDAIKLLIPFYIFLFCLMLILFFIISRSFIKIYKQQVELESARQDLINAVAHELKTPLGVIRSFCEGLKEKINEDKEEHYLDVIQNETGRMKDIVSEMLALSQLESGVELTKQSISLKHIAEQVVERYIEALDNKGITVIVNFSDNCVIKCDKKHIEQVISNFLSNAIHHTFENGEINISIVGDNGKFIFSIENTGQQIPTEKINHIWNAYYKTDSSRTNPKGTGLGLSIVKNILNAHGYAYGVENIKCGVRFWFST